MEKANKNGHTQIHALLQAFAIESDDLLEFPSFANKSSLKWGVENAEQKYSS